MTDAATLWDDEEMPIARAALVEAVGEPGAIRAMGVTGNYAMMNRALDGIGNPIWSRLATMAPELGITEWRHDLRA